jgi:hypothetical protein
MKQAADYGEYYLKCEEDKEQQDYKSILLKHPLDMAHMRRED